MNPIVQLRRQVKYPFIALLFASLAVVQSVQAEADEADPIGDVAEENAAVSDLSSEQATAAKAPSNKQVMPIKITKSLGCASGNVILSGNVVVTFRQTEVGVVWIHSIKFQGFKGTAVNGNRKLRATEESLKFLHKVSFSKSDKKGEFGFQFTVTVPGLPASSD